MGWGRVFGGRRLQASMGSCTRQREPLVDCPHSRRIQERPLRARENPRKIWSKPLEARGKRGPRRGRRRKLRRRLRNRQGSLETRSRLRRGQGRAHETKSLLEHLIESNKEKKTTAGRRRPTR